MKKTLLIIVAIIAILAGGFFVLNSYIYNEKQADYSLEDLQWVIEDTEKATDISPHQRVTLKVAGTVLSYALGEYPLDCRGPYPGPLEENQLSKVWCSWGGAGLEFGVFSNNGTYVIKERWHDEGSAVIPGGFGSWKIRYMVGE